MPSCVVAGSNKVVFMLDKIKNWSFWGWKDGSVVKHSYSHRGPEFSSHHPSWCLTTHWNSSSRGPYALSWHIMHIIIKKIATRVSHNWLSQLNNVPRAGYVELRKTTRHRAHSLQHHGTGWRRQWRWWWSPVLGAWGLLLWGKSPRPPTSTILYSVHAVIVLSLTRYQEVIGEIPCNKIPLSEWLVSKLVH